ncbi:Transposase [Anoxybacillus flavithermus WK1]|uniref:Transposase n=1 Tax=Anoxybacillus flavithermus (strain DSM 21510 / WK1) TaxID=491915 RepID=B7GJA6_ANOFW|nr:Transposase [Anoxybacillus flavithermus WK1]
MSIMTRRFDKEFKIHAVKLVVEEGKAVAQTARQLDISPKTLHKWVAGYKKDARHSFVGSGNLKPEDREKRELQKRIRDLEEENAILKKAMSIFAKNQK